MRDPFLGSDRHNGLCLRIEVYIIVALVPTRDGMTKARDPSRSRVAMILAVPGHLDEFIDNVGRGRLIGIPHPKIDDVLATMPRLEFQRLDLRKHIWGKPF
jgi:hypothetical protein